MNRAWIVTLTAATGLLLPACPLAADAAQVAVSGRPAVAGEEAVSGRLAVAGEEGVSGRPAVAGEKAASARLAAAPKRAGKEALTCAVSTPSEHPLTFTPTVGLTTRRISARGYLELTGCTSPDHSAPFLRSAWVNVKATAQASCATARRVRGTAVITWFGATGRPAGASKLAIKADRLVARHPADTLLTGTVRTGWLAGKRVAGGIAPPTAILGCAASGLHAYPGHGTITFG
ncbi:hypothetical protein [Nonomuraea sp. NPDC049309]|uniref:hypothetical protein n=1 Tax=Nonomuraea sp. NPDC049309 TaxID=3364350 RepID=UPI00371A996F